MQLCLFVFLAFLLAAALGKPNASGKVESGRRIVGGWSAHLINHPWMAAVLARAHFDPKKPVSLLFQCGGSILSEYYVLTAARCTSGKKTATHVRYASASANVGYGITIPVKAIHNHPDYTGEKAPAYAHDIGILELASAIVFSDIVKKVTLSMVEPYPGEVGIFTGWGQERRDGPLPKNLKAMNTVTLEIDACRKLASKRGFNLSPTHICADNPGEGNCKGDAGGPLSIGRPPIVKGKEFGSLLQVGIASFHIGKCASKPFMEIYTGVAAYKNFIDDITQNTAQWGCQFSWMCEKE